MAGEQQRRPLGRSYHRRLQSVYRSLIPPGGRVLEIGSGNGDLLASVQPAEGVGIDFSPAMVRHARARHPGLEFLPGDAHQVANLGTFDAVILSDLVNDVWDVQGVLEGARSCMTPRSRLVINVYSRLWEPPLTLAQHVGLARPVLGQNWLSAADVLNLLRLSGFETIRHWQEVLLPLPIPGLAALCNRVLVKLWPLNHLALTNFFIARISPQEVEASALRVSVVVPARNEEGNIPAVFARTPEMGAGTELILVEGNSQDRTWDAIQAALAAHPERRARALRQSGKGKGDAVRLGFAEATGDVLMILDADLTVAPEDLPRFFEAIRTGRGEMVNGVRLVYPREEQAMRFANLIGNKLFSLAFTWLLGQPVKDSLCGTKVLRREDYLRLAANRSYFGDFDPFGDFDLLFGAARLNLAIVDLPVRYGERTYGSTNIQRWRHGLILLRMCLFAAGRLKFV